MVVFFIIESCKYEIYTRINKFLFLLLLDICVIFEGQKAQ